MLSNAYARESLLDQLPQTLKSAVNLKLPKAPKAIANEVFAPLLVAEIDLLKQANALLLSSRNYEVYLAKANAIPNILQEIGRQREETFRAIGEGTNKAIDLDVFERKSQIPIPSYKNLQFFALRCPIKKDGGNSRQKHLNLWILPSRPL